MLQCEDVRNEFQAFLSNEVNEPQRREISDHIENCRDCSRALRQLEKLSEVLPTGFGLKIEDVEVESDEFGVVTFEESVDGVTPEPFPDRLQRAKRGPDQR